jgi:hypothetical protein
MTGVVVSWCRGAVSSVMCRAKSHHATPTHRETRARVHAMQHEDPSLDASETLGALAHHDIRHEVHALAVLGEGAGRLSTVHWPATGAGGGVRILMAGECVGYVQCLLPRHDVLGPNFVNGWV